MICTSPSTVPSIGRARMKCPMRPMNQYGPNDLAVRRLIERARSLPTDDAHALLTARIAWISEREVADAENTALRHATSAARRSGRLAALGLARADAAAAFRLARHNEIGPWLSVASAITNAAAALVVADLLEYHDYEVLYRPWRQAVAGAELVPVGPGHQPALGVPQRRRLGGRTVGGNG